MLANSSTAYLIYFYLLVSFLLLLSKELSIFLTSLIKVYNSVDFINKCISYFFISSYIIYLFCSFVNYLSEKSEDSLKIYSNLLKLFRFFRLVVSNELRNKAKSFLLISMLFFYSFLYSKDSFDCLNNLISDSFDCLKIFTSDSFDYLIVLLTDSIDS